MKSILQDGLKTIDQDLWWTFQQFNSAVFIQSLSIVYEMN